MASKSPRPGWRVPHRSTVNKILKRAGLVKDEPRKRPRSSFCRFACARPRDCYGLSRRFYRPLVHIMLYSHYLRKHHSIGFADLTLSAICT
jgi:hypothetical protein